MKDKAKQSILLSQKTLLNLRHKRSETFISFCFIRKNALKITVNNIASQCLALDSRVKSAWVQHKDYVGLINYLASFAQKVQCNPPHKTVQLLNKWGLFRYTEVTPLKTCSYTW